MKAIVIIKDNGTAYLQRLAPESATEAPLTDQEEVIIELYYKLQKALKGDSEETRLNIQIIGTKELLKMVKDHPLMEESLTERLKILEDELGVLKQNQIIK